ncbi:hypothetical protein [Mucilaginibacter gynuensis]|uniref:hypothetical protein n=1 Tax=Mucilaginibacter gynuensis TaxID=1302236 RepID=UPI0031E65145
MTTLIQRVNDFPYVKASLAFIFNLTFIFSLYILLLYLGVLKYTPDPDIVIQYDSIWFDVIKKDGYVYHPNMMSNMAFFPLFSYLWKWTGLDGMQICYFNLLLFFLSFLFLLGKRKLSIINLLIMASFPSFAFLFLPYSESTFFIFGVLLINGYKSNSRTFQIIGLLGCCLTRSVSTIFIPAVIFTEIFSYLMQRKNVRTHIINATVNTLTCLFSILIVVFIQGYQTGKWFYYIEVQKYWKRHWLIPSLPFTTVSPVKMTGIDTISLVLGLVALCFCIKYALKYFKSQAIFKNENVVKIPKSVYFSALYLVGILILDTCFTYNLRERTNMQCLGRHLLCTAFAVEFITWLVHDYTPTAKDLYVAVFILLLGCVVTEVYQYPQHALYFVLFYTSLLVPYLFRYTSYMRYMLYLMNVFFLIIFYHDFLSGFWIG